MSDDSPRSAHGNPPDQRRGSGIPAWWLQLDRNDLPDDQHLTAYEEDAVDEAAYAEARRRQRAGAAGLRTRIRVWRSVAIGLLVMVVAFVVVVFSVGATTPAAAVALAFLVGLPALLASAASLLFTRRGR